MRDSVLEPISLQEAKIYLKIEHEIEDQLILTLIESARKFTENYTGINIIKAHLNYQIPYFYGGIIELPGGYISEVLYAKMGENIYRTPDIELVKPSNVKINIALIGRIEFVYICGFNRDEIPADLKYAIFSIMANMYNARDSFKEPSVTIKTILNKYKKIRLI